MIKSDNMRRSALAESGKDLEEFFRNEANVLSMFCCAQRFIWEKNIFPQRFNYSDRFECRICRTRTQDLGICLTCGCVICKNHIRTHKCKMNYAIDINTHQLFIVKNNIRRFLFHPKLDNLVLASKFAVVDDLPLSQELKVSSPVFPFPVEHVPLFPFKHLQNIASVIYCIINDFSFAKFFMSFPYSSKKCESIYHALYIILSKMILNNLNGKEIPFIEFLSVLTRVPEFDNPGYLSNVSPVVFFSNLMIALLNYESVLSISDVIAIKLTKRNECTNCGVIYKTPEWIFGIDTENRSITHTIEQKLFKLKPVSCQKCDKQLESGSVIEELPPTLIISSDIEKKHPLEFYITEHDKKYKLKSFIVQNSDQYFAVVKKHGQWYKCDEDETRVSNDFVKSLSPTLLFYNRYYIYE